MFIQNVICLGDYRNAQIYINGNLLTRFEESVFKQMLSQMIGSARGKLSAPNSEHYIR